MSFLELGDDRIWYEDSGGSGTPLVFVHPAAASSECWVNQLPAFTAAGYRCITYDLRGWHRSRPVSDRSGRTYLSDDLDALASHLGLNRFDLVAAAYGGFGGVDYALRFPRRLRAFVLATSQGGVTDPDIVALRERVASAEIRALPIELRELGPSYRAEDPDGVARWLQVVHDAGAETARRQCTRLEITLGLLETLAVPSLLLAADADLLAPPALMRLFAARIPNCRFASVPEAGHSAHWERPAEWNKIVLEFLNGCR